MHHVVMVQSYFRLIPFYFRQAKTDSELTQKKETNAIELKWEKTERTHSGMGLPGQAAVLHGCISRFCFVHVVTGITASMDSIPNQRANRVLGGSSSVL